MLPLLDARDINDLINRIKELYPHYTPEWRFTPENSDPGTALFLIFAKMHADTIKRFNQVPGKNFIAFLNMLGLVSLPSRPASAFVTFSLSAGAKEPVLIQPGTQVSATVKGEKDPVIFETQEDLLVTPAVPVATYNVSAAKDSIIRLSPGLFGSNENRMTEKAVLFNFPEEENLQEHCFYLGHTDIFNISNTALIELELKNSKMSYRAQSFSQRLADLGRTRWMYYGEDPEGTGKWYDFDNVYLEQGKIILKKAKFIPFLLHSIEGCQGRWLRCCLTSAMEPGYEDIEADGLHIGVKYLDYQRQGGFAPDQIFRNDVELENSGCYPFGENFAVYDTFYISSQEAFSKKNAEITLQFDLGYVMNRLSPEVKKEVQWKMIMKASDFQTPPPPPEIFIANVIWEYWNGSGWAKLLSNKEYEEIFSCEGGVCKKTVTFQCPEDMQESIVNNRMNYWIRIRIISIRNLYTPEMLYRSPWIENLLIRYEYKGSRSHVFKCLSYNNLEWDAGTLAEWGKNKAFKLFRRLDCEYPAWYVGFDRPPLNGPVNIFFSIETQQGAEQNIHYEWEYLKQQGISSRWSELKTVDRTKAFTESGLVTFFGPQDFTGSELFGDHLFWIRLVNKDKKLENAENPPALPTLHGVYINTVRVVQQESITAEMLEAMHDMQYHEYRLSKYPVISEELWVNEVSCLTEDERKTLLLENPGAVEEVKDDAGRVSEFWVRWQAVDDFLESDVGNRHFSIDRLTGRIKFGNGKHGMMPPVIHKPNIRVNYKIGGGTKGNLPAQSINTLQKSIAFIDTVFNPEPSGGGCNFEAMEETMKRGPHVVKHRNRAVTKSDLEWLAMEASRNIARVKCLTHYHVHGVKETGGITLVVFAKDDNSGSLFFPELKQQVEKYIYERTANIVALPRKINVIEPVRLEISVNTVLVVSEPEMAMYVEKAAIAKLDAFLNPFEGNYKGTGWEIAEYPHVSMFYTLLKSVQGVNYVDKVSLTVCEITDGIRVEKDPGIFESLPHGMILNGKHKVNVRWL